ncbi:MAG: NAD(P)H-dependent oxidoreductase subunit E [Gammaproteobacteria bacterium]|nr:NAD(P)H-dependent oxidoreductase subunit E [Gammaproteobacteria bacterium]
MDKAVTRKRNKMRGEKRGRSVNPLALQQVRELLGDMPIRRDLLIEYLHLIQDKYFHISADHMTALASVMKLATTEVYEVASFYHHFDLVKEGHHAPPELTIRVCDSVSCEMNDAKAIINTLGGKYNGEIRVQPVPCVGRCEQAPVAVVGTNAIPYANIDKIVAAVDKNEKEAVAPACINFEEYKKDGGYQTLSKLINGSLSKEDVITTLEDSNLRGLGGAGFPAGRKWRIVGDQPAPRIMAVNIDEGEPGTFKDRYYLERDPHRFLEGMLIAAYVVGTDAIYIYLRDEYAGVRKALTSELEKLKAGLPHELPHIELRRGAGAYICGEESAMIESIEGKRGMPRLRPPFVAQVGVFGRPTLEHNMETLYWVRDLIERGAEWFTSNGRHDRKGLRSFSVSGRVKNPGVHLAPAGITVKELIDEFCGGMLEGHEFYGYFPGGASGGILPASMGDIPMDFDTLNEYGCFIGSAAVMIFSNQDSAKQLAHNAMKFFSHESCGKCTPCRVGTSKAVMLMDKDDWNQPLMKELSQTMNDASICGLGQAASNPMQCVINYFPEELK